MTRPAASIGAGLAPARTARPIRDGERLHVVGIAGAGASGAALVAAHARVVVDGCDSDGESPYTPALAEAGIPVLLGHDPAHVERQPAPDRLAVTKALTSIAPDHPELEAARRRGIPLEPWQQVVADAAVGRTLVGVAGTHGKSTTAGWLVDVLVAAGEDPAAFVGALLPTAITGGVPATARRGRGAAFVVEADEYAGNFDPYRPAIAVLTNADWDHPDVFADRDAVIETYVDWLAAAALGGDGPRDGPPPVLVANVADRGAELVVGRMAGWPGTVIATALLDGASAPRPGLLRGMADQYTTGGGPARGLLGRIVGADPSGTTLEITGLDPLTGSVVVRIATAGRHNAANALGVVGAALALGLSRSAVVASIGRFSGVGRRLERKGEAGGVVVYDDYGHHPTAIRATIAAVRQREPGRPLWAVYEPLTFHRTAALLDRFAFALADADGVAIADIWAGRDLDTASVSGADLAAAIAQVRPGIDVVAPGSVEVTAAWLAAHVRAGDVVLVMGGGRSYRIAELLLATLA
ncbi:MAG: hypothetical protein IVW53_02200 [Chloroflexi bacterium]|nr:hypothetical protein [Chloroflexota bacterium]